MLLDTTQYLAENTQRLTQLGYSQEKIQAIAKYQVMLDAKHSPEVGQVICDRITNILFHQSIKTVLTFDYWKGHTLFAKDAKGYPYVVPGSWWDIRYVVRGLIRQRRKNTRWHWYINGQAAEGSINVGHFGEQVQLRFSEFDGISDQWLRSLSAVKTLMEEKDESSKESLSAQANHSKPQS